ncbi:ABC transporter ATP-binding protein [Falsirhodobacter halotolerans]|uniref:ABC transporter ATP-binding protein n=1 Tax=Falsirhodobacter halotolerans TaxID=1146892 RepID=UPI001FD03F6A|nr:ABC transporter ATP-binding protein [Falsirhodobacter halotolerans]MCJ8141258.1 ABC transporter ATP-binding protein [Falsirhodobacter halotolerans]
MGQLSLKNIVKSFGTYDAVQDVSLDVADGEFVVFVGPSGCGKSTLLRMIAGLDSTTEGDILIDGARVNDLPPVKRGIAMVFQSYALYPHMSVFENIAFPLRVEKAPEAVIRDKVQAAARILHLEERLQQKPGMLSGGQRQRVAIGRAIVREPKIFLFDEPLSNLDAALRGDMRVELTRLHRQLGATMIYVTHDQVEAMTMADRIVVLGQGRIAQIGTPLELYLNPRDMFVATFIGSPRMNMIPVRCVEEDARGLTVEFLGQRLALAIPGGPGRVGQDMTLGIRPEHIHPGPGDAMIEVTPTVVEHLGQQTVAHASLDGGATTFSLLLPGNADVVPDRPLSVGFAAADCHLFGSDGQALPRP